MDEHTKTRIAEECAKRGVGLCYLFGSQALPEDPDELADVDLGIVPLGWPEERGELRGWFALQSGIEPLVEPRTLDLVQLDRAGCQLQHEAVTKGELLYSADEELRVRFEDRVVREWMDFAYVMDANFRDIRDELLGPGAGGRIA